MNEDLFRYVGHDGRDDRIEQLTVAFRGLLWAEDAEGRAQFAYGNEYGKTGYCHICNETNGHKDACVVQIAERVLNHEESMVTDPDNDHTYCPVCMDVDGHEVGCVVDIAERALRGVAIERRGANAAANGSQDEGGQSWTMK